MIVHSLLQLLSDTTGHGRRLGGVGRVVEVGRCIATLAVLGVIGRELLQPPLAPLVLLLAGAGLELLPLLAVAGNDELVLFVLAGELGVGGAQMVEALGLGGQAGFEVGEFLGGVGIRGAG